MNEIKEVTQEEVASFALKFFPKFKISDSPFDKVCVYTVDDEIIGFILYSVMYEKSEIEYFAVKEGYRGKGISQELFDYVISDLKKCRSVSLEVNCSNERAINFYKKNGFEMVSVREKYYDGKDGFLMVKKLGD